MPRIRLKHKALAELLSRRRLSQNAWAQRLGLSRGHLSMLLKGLRPYPRPETRRRLLEGLEAPFDALFEIDSERDLSRPPVAWSDRRAPLREWLWSGVRMGARALAQSPAFAIISILTVALGVGAASGVFTVVETVLLRPLPYHEPDRLFWLAGAPIHSRESEGLLDWADEVTSLEVGAYNVVGGTVNLSEQGNPILVHGTEVIPGFFSLLGAEVSGRGFREEESQTGQNRVVVLSDGLRNSLYGADADVLGRDLRINGNPYRIVGVAPPDFSFPKKVRFWVPSCRGDSLFFGAALYGVLGRLRADFTPEQARLELQQFGERMRAETQATAASKFRFRIVPLRERLVSGVRTRVWVLFGAVGLLLLIACGSVANLMLARASEKRNEVVIRSALGAGRRHIVGRLLSESLLIFTIGGGLGFLLSLALVRAAPLLLPPDLPRIGELKVDVVVFAFALLTSIVCGLVFGLLPARQASRVELNEALRQAGIGPVGHRRPGLRSALVVAEISLATVLLVLASLFSISFVKLAEVDPGFVADEVVSYRFRLPGTSYPTADSRREFERSLIERISRDPAIDAVATVNYLPFGGGGAVSGLIDTGDPDEPINDRAPTMYVFSGDYFKALRIPIVEGRAFEPTVQSGSEPVVMINQVLAERYYPDGAVGEHLRLAGSEPLRIVGVAESIKAFDLGQQREMQIYLPSTQIGLDLPHLVIRSRAETARLSEIVRAEVQSIDPALAVSEARTMRSLLDRDLANERATLVLMGVFAIFSAILAMLGVYGVARYVHQRSFSEYAVRLALGADNGELRSLALRRGLRLCVLGIVLGVPPALAAGRLVTTLLFETPPAEPLALAAACLSLGSVGLLASWLPVRHLSRIDPVRALRS